MLCLLWQIVGVTCVTASAGVRNFAEALEKELQEEKDEPATAGEDEKSTSNKEESDPKEDENVTKKDTSN